MATKEMQRPVKTVCDIGRADLAGVQSHATMADAARLMRDLDIGSAAVFEASKLIGIVTERDVLLAAIDCADLERAPVAAFMTELPATISIDADVSQAALAMRALHARHLPVVDRDHVVGMVSSRDLLEVLDTHSEVLPMRRRRWSTLWRRGPRIAET
jgi:CBS domain-containing protein